MLLSRLSIAVFILLNCLTMYKGEAAELKHILRHENIANDQKEINLSYMLNEGLHIPEQEIEGLESEAYLGSSGAADKLVKYYDGIKLDHKNAMNWSRIAAENGGKINHYNYGAILTRSQNPNDIKRARFWLNLAKQEGEPSAGEYLKLLDDPDYARKQIDKLWEMRCAEEAMIKEQRK